MYSKKIFDRKNRFKPQLKKLIKLRENVFNSKKLLKLKKIKWESLIKHYERKLKRYRKYKPYDVNKYVVSKYPSRGNSYRKKFRYILFASQIFRLFYGNISKNCLKKNIKISLKSSNKSMFRNNLFLETFESKLNIVLYRAKFVRSLREAQQFILHGKILINNKTVKSKTHILKQGDLVSINQKYMNDVKKNIQSISSNQFLPPKHLLINYKILQILFGNLKHTNLSTFFNFNLNIDKILINYKRY